MSKQRQVLFAAAAVAIIGAIAFYGWRWASQRPVVYSPEVLAEQALHADTPEVREESAVKLATQASESRQLLRQVFRETESSPVRAACITGLSRSWDYDSMDDLLIALEDESPLVRGRAGAAVQKMLGVDFYFRANDPLERRAAAIEKLREAWHQMQSSGKLTEWNSRREAVD